MPYRDDNLRGQTESPAQAQRQKVANLYADVTRLFNQLDHVNDPAVHLSPEERRQARGGLAAEIDKAVESYAASLKELARM